MLDRLNMRLGTEHAALIGPLYALARLALATQPRLAEVAARRILAIEKRVAGPRSCTAATAMTMLAHILTHLGDNATALELLTEAREIKLKELSCMHFNCALLSTSWAFALLRSGDGRRAFEALDEAASVLVASLGPAHPWAADIKSLQEQFAVFAKQFITQHMNTNLRDVFELMQKRQQQERKRRHEQHMIDLQKEKLTL